MSPPNSDIPNVGDNSNGMRDPRADTKLSSGVSRRSLGSNFSAPNSVDSVRGSVHSVCSVNGSLSNGAVSFFILRKFT